MPAKPMRMKSPNAPLNPAWQRSVKPGSISIGARNPWTGSAIVFAGTLKLHATRKNRYSTFDITDSSEEPDPLAQRFAPQEEPEPQEGEAQPQEGALFCPYCGAPMQEDYKFCRKCGRQVE